MFQYGGSSNEVVNGRTLGSLYIDKSETFNQAVDYISLLSTHDYEDFSAVHSAGRSLFDTVIRSPESAAAIKMLSKLNVDPGEVFSTFGSYLHRACSTEGNDASVAYLLDHGCGQHINRQDQYGWTPVHYAVSSAFSNRRDPVKCPDYLQKLKLLGQKGCEVSLAGHKPPYIYLPELDEDETIRITPLEYAERLEGLCPELDMVGFAQEIRDALTYPHGERCSEQC